MNFFGIEFLNREFFVLILLVPVILYFFYRKQKKFILFSFFSDIKNVYKKNAYSFIIRSILFSLVFIFYILIISNPNLPITNQKTNKSGIDIVLILDISFSMEATDLTPTRLDKAKEVLTQFINVQKTNRVGLIVFAGKPFTSIPLTFDYNILKETLSNLKTSTINQNNKSLAGTAIGDSILMGETLFNYDNNREKVIILITDGDSTTGVDPKLAAQNSKEKSIKIYTIGIGSEKGGTAEYISGGFKQTQVIPPINDSLLKEVSNITSGEYFRATDSFTLENIFRYLEKLEKQNIEIEINKVYSNDYIKFVYPLIFFLFVFIVYSLNKREL